MALTPFQRTICRLIAKNRLVSRDLDLFHDTDEALHATWHADRRLLESHGYQVGVVREHRTFVQAEVIGADGRVQLDWARDSSFRFFPLVTRILA